jgi:hypothetical protein
MPDLILDTSRDTYLIVLFDAEKVLDVKNIAHENNLSASLLPDILDLLKKNQFGIKSILNLFVGVGPGSYTGTRIAVSVATGLSLALSCPLYSFCSLLAFLPENLKDGPFSLCMETKHTNFLLEGSLKKGLLSSGPKGQVISSPPPPFSIKPQKTPNLPPLLFFLLNLKKQPPTPFKVLYLHKF